MCQRRREGAEKPCVDHVPALLFTQHGFARTTFLLDYPSLEKERQNMSGPPCTISTTGWKNAWTTRRSWPWPRWRPSAAAGALPAKDDRRRSIGPSSRNIPNCSPAGGPRAPAAVLYAYWGPNPLSAHQGEHLPTIHQRLLGSHRPYVGLVDAWLPDGAAELADFVAIYLESPAYEMSARQLKALGDYARRGRIVVGDRRATINGRPIVELLESRRVTIWDPKRPTLPTTAIAPSEGLQQNLRFAIYQKADRLAVHVVNYNVCLLDRQKKAVGSGIHARWRFRCRPAGSRPRQLALIPEPGRPCCRARWPTVRSGSVCRSCTFTRSCSWNADDSDRNR